jgi:hypothetical protein
MPPLQLTLNTIPSYPGSLTMLRVYDRGSSHNSLAGKGEIIMESIDQLGKRTFNILNLSSDQTRTARFQGADVDP